MTEYEVTAMRALYMSRVQETFRILFRVWEGTENADEILKDAARTIGYRVFNIPAENGALNYFEALCQDQTNARFGYPMLNGAASPSAE